MISWGGAQGGTGGAFAPPACMLKKALIEHEFAPLCQTCDVNKARDCTRWIAPCLFVLFHKACWEVKRLAIYGCDVRLFPRLSRLNKEL